MKKLKSFAHNINKDCSCSCSFVATLLKSDLSKFDVPVAEDIPDEVVELLYSNTKFELIEVVCNFLSKSVVL